jgi:hypothetical protein
MNSPLPADLLELKAQFDHWRSIRPYIRQPIPEDLRHAALEMSQRYSPELVGRVLKLDPQRRRASHADIAFARSDRDQSPLLRFLALLKLPP